MIVDYSLFKNNKTKNKPELSKINENTILD